MFGRVAKTAVGTKTGRKASRAALKGAWKAGNTRAARKSGKGGAVGIGRMAKIAAKTKAGKEAGKAGARGAAKAGRGFGKVAARKGKREVRVAHKNLGSGRSGGSRLVKFGLLVVAVVAVGALVSRLKGGDTDSSFSDTTGHHAPDAGSPAGARGETAGTGTPTDSAGGTGAGGVAQDPAHSDPSSGPLIGEAHSATAGVGEEQQEVEQRIRTRIGEDERTRDMPRVNVEVVDGVAELRGEAPSEAAKDAAGEIAAQAEGVREVRNLIEVSS